MSLLRSSSVLALIMIMSGAAFTVGGFFEERNIYPMYRLKQWRVEMLQRFTASDNSPADEFGRLKRFPGKVEIACPPQTGRTKVLLVVGQSNAANHHGQRLAAVDDRVVNFADGRCYIAGSPLLGAEGTMGESWTLLGNELVETGVADRVILVPAGVGATEISRWTSGGDLNAMLARVAADVRKTYTITEVLWHQGESDFQKRTPENAYRTALENLIGDFRRWRIQAPVFISKASYGQSYPGWVEDNEVIRAQRSVINGVDVLAGPDTDSEIGPSDRYDGTHFSLTGQKKFADRWLSIISRWSRFRLASSARDSSLAAALKDVRPGRDMTAQRSAEVAATVRSVVSR